MLIVEDDREGADALAELIACLGHTTRAVYDGESAVRTAAETEFDLVLIDLNLPGISGFQVAQQLRAAQGRRLTLVAVTASGADEDVVRARAAGFDDYVVKPVDTTHLARHLSR